jgi:hypothetical protein
LAQAPLHFQQLEGFGVAAALEKMAKLGIDRLGQLLFELLDPFGNGSQAFGVPDWIAAAFFVGDAGETFAQGGGEVGENFSIGKSLKRGNGRVLVRGYPQSASHAGVLAMRSCRQMGERYILGA